ncbi:MAG: NUDIX domain-containing protein [Deltaproteobacteria bacterium]|nr:NUDIX domain-containing protein [Deltaproteobacteria bacterium]
MAAQFFRANVGIILCNANGQVLAFQRADRPGQWQLPQGGLRKNEEPLEAALRELEEETGLTRSEVELIGEHPRWLAYELPPEARRKKTGRGQVQKFFLFRLRTSATVKLDRAAARELDDHHWTTLVELAESTWSVRRATYLELAAHFAPQLDRD